MSNDYHRCKTCGEYGWFGDSAVKLGAHRCPPSWQVRMHETKWESEWRDIHARDLEEAASKFCQQHDSNGDYDIITNGDAVVEVRKSEADPATIVEIRAESVPTYYARARSPQEKADE